MASVSSSAQESNNYSALNALSQLSTAVHPTYSMQGQNVDAANHSAVIAALRTQQLTTSATPTTNMQSQQKVQVPNHSAANANAMTQYSAQMAQWQYAQAMHAQYMQSQANALNGHKSNDKNGNKIEEKIADTKKEVVKPPINNYRNSTPNRMPLRGGGTIRPRVPPYRCRNETGNFFAQSLRSRQSK